MADKNKQTSLKQSLSRSDAGHGQTIKKANKTRAITKGMATLDENRSDDEEDALEMERNFALFSKRSVMPAPEDGKGEEEMSPGALDDEHVEDDDDIVKERYTKSSGDMSGPDDDSDNYARDSRPLEDNGTTAKLHTSDELQRGLSALSFEEIIRLQNKVGTKAYNKIAYGTMKNKQTAEPIKRLNKHRPDEISAKKSVPFLRKVVPVKKTILRDPRFDDLSGDFRPEVFKQTYKFIDEIRQREAQTVKKKLKKVKSDTKREKLKLLLKRMENQERAQKKQEQQREKELQFKRKQRELVGQGHRPFYLKKSEKKKLELAEKYNELKKSGKLENFLSKKRKRNAIKDRKKLPYQHKKN
ncbi:ribosomal RNA processing protein 36 homolog [Colossoma macropomum]|uniref:ribosomal RNA processing protein 36 homolog n=1 Tax=Colossoma macropomum TaxID=42526 RepID=UPI0018650E9F|nr:ribosomal RNA processing protein 36 homolog [Colossoma macropomum]XP_036442877.1 ribosomal RNA processing protein 36 homolog [Colossoma macropomum]